MIAKKTVGVSLSWIPLALFALAGQVGCGGGAPARVCDFVCFCEQCSDDKRTTCEATGRRSEDLAAETGCQAQYNLLTACLDDRTQVRCEGMHATTENCNAELAVYRKCTTEHMTPSESTSGAGG